MLKLFIQDACGSSHYIKVSPQDTMLQIKDKACTTTSEHATKMQLETFAKSTRLERQGKPLNDYFTVSDYSVKDDDTLHLKGCLLAGADNIQITIVTSSGNKDSILIQYDAKVKTLKERITESMKLNSDFYDL